RWRSALVRKERERYARPERLEIPRHQVTFAQTSPFEPPLGLLVEMVKARVAIEPMPSVVRAALALASSSTVSMNADTADELSFPASAFVIVVAKFGSSPSAAASSSSVLSRLGAEATSAATTACTKAVVAIFVLLSELPATVGAV